MSEDVSLWVGIDLGNRTHQFCVLDQDSRVLLERPVKHTGEAIDKLADELLTLAEGEPSRIAASAETTWGAVVETLLERGVSVFSINPKQLDRFRDRYTVAGAKDDRRDAFVLADSLRKDRSLYSPLSLGDPEVVELRELVRVYEDLKPEVVMHGNRLGEQLRRYYPQLLELGSVYADRWLWELWELAPRPEMAKRLSPAKVEALLKKHRIRRVTADRILEALDTVPLRVAPGVEAACVEHVSMLLPRLRMAHLERLECEKKIAAKLELLSRPVVGDQGRTEHSDAAILLSMPGVGTIVGATILSEAAGLLADRNLVRLRARSGTAPVTKQSGKSKFVVRRLARNVRLQDAVYHWSRTSVQNDSRSKAHYERLRAVGHRHGRALRGVADRLLSILVAMLRNRELYDPRRGL